MPETNPDELVDLYVDGHYWGTVTRRELDESAEVNRQFRELIVEEIDDAHAALIRGLTTTRPGDPSGPTERNTL